MGAYAMVRGLFQHRRNVLVEGMRDYYFLHALSLQCRATKRSALPEDKLLDCTVTVIASSRIGLAMPKNGATTVRAGGAQQRPSLPRPV